MQLAHRDLKRVLVVFSVPENKPLVGDDHAAVGMSRKPEALHGFYVEKDALVCKGRTPEL